MAYVPIILGVVALIVAVFTFLKMGGIVSRTKALERKNRELEAGLKSLENQLRRSGKNQPQENGRQQGRGNQQNPQLQPQQPKAQQPQEQKQRNQNQQPGRGQQEPREKQGQPQQQGRQPQEPRPKQEGQPQQQRPPREPREPRQPQEPREPRQPQEQRQRQPQQPQQQPVAGSAQPAREPRQPQQQQRRNENRRREPVMPGEELNPANQPVAAATLGQGIVGDDLLNELTQQSAPTPAPAPEPVSRTRYAIIPEDGTIKTHQLQQRPDSDSYLEIDSPVEGVPTTNYRFNLGGNQAFVISQGMDRLENAFSFEKPSNRMVSQIIQQGDGLLVRTSSGWKIQDKARIDFR
ncbi:hypothetical protein [Rufibacter hautae]|uniref:Uncharacterized protein n=1 Tax=Rufibacter hautae TaxID=2595005 RepID=A0A5B6TP09_9BACT|nr:hypothetical protein [Rufibacter hautae]KAA3438143.1 hypothetical protein FOA19_12830 [Rufibacter hautae]